ncbi:MAG: hypothetical protein VKP62_01805 [Candidatus Sericytochromatia bacterium]|nr:hypothetical protein [Candidatus Sericytochromatia bacterium]
MTRPWLLILVFALLTGCFGGAPTEPEAQEIATAKKRPTTKAKSTAGGPSYATADDASGERFDSSLGEPGKDKAASAPIPTPTPPNGVTAQAGLVDSGIQIHFEELSGRWAIRPSLNRARMGHAAGGLSDRLIVAEGDHRPSFEELLPGGEAWRLDDTYDLSWGLKTDRLARDQGLNLVTAGVQKSFDELWVTGGMAGSLDPTGRLGSALFYLYRGRGFSRARTVETGSFTLGTLRYAAAGGVVGSEFVVVGGSNKQGTVLNKTEIVDIAGTPKANNRIGAPMPWPEGEAVASGVAGAASATAENQLFVVGGYVVVNGRPVVQKAVHSYNVKIDAWTRLPDLPKEVHGAAAAVMDDTLYVVGGFDSKGVPQGAFYAYPLTTGDRWLTPPAMPTARGMLTLTPFRGMLWAIGGVGANRRALQTVEVYRP